MGTIILETLSDYDKHGYDLEVWCRACGHKVVIVPRTLFALGLLGSVAKIERRLKCSKCQGRQAIVSPTSAGPSGGRRRGGSWLDRVGEPKG